MFGKSEIPTNPNNTDRVGLVENKPFFKDGICCKIFALSCCMLHSKLPTNQSKCSLGLSTDSLP